MIRKSAQHIRFSHRTMKLICAMLLASVAAIIMANHLIVSTSQELTWNDVNAVPARSVGLVLGARPSNNYFTRRINAAASLYHAGKVKWLLFSGDNGRKNYDEPSAMQQALVAQGVPESVILCDYAGFSTLDSVVRAQKIFGEEHITVISQEFHNQRAIWLAQQYGIDAIGFNAPDLSKGRGKTVWLREKLARVSAVIDAKILHRQPKYLGASVIIGPTSQHGCPASK